MNNLNLAVNSVSQVAGTTVALKARMDAVKSAIAELAAAKIDAHMEFEKAAGRDPYRHTVDGFPRSFQICLYDIDADRERLGPSAVRADAAKFAVSPIFRDSIMDVIAEAVRQRVEKDYKVVQLTDSFDGSLIAVLQDPLTNAKKQRPGLWAQISDFFDGDGSHPFSIPGEP